MVSADPCFNSPKLPAAQPREPNQPYPTAIAVFATPAYHSPARAPGRLKDFEREYGPAGKWTEFFRRSPEYVGTELFRSIESPNRFITLDTWRTRSGYEAFRKSNAEEYAKLDKWCEQFTLHERTLGMVDDGRSA